MSTVPVSLAGTPDDDLAIDLRETEGVRTILFFDGVCGLCNQAVDFVLKRDRKKILQFAPLQGETARVLLSPADIDNLNSMVLWVDGKAYRKSAAAVRILWLLGSGWKVLGTIFCLIPSPLRDVVYSLIAANRYRIFGKKESCRIPTPEERVRFLP